MNDNDIAKALDKAVRYYGQKVDAVLSSGNYPSGKDPYRDEYKPIEKTKVVHDPITADGKVSQTITYGSEKEAPYAVAYEFGSGEQGPKGETYVIRSKGKLLAIGLGPLKSGRSAWKPSNKKAVFASKKFRGLFEYENEDVYLFDFVDHPGVEPRPFAQPTLTKELNNMTKIVGQEIFASIVRTLNDDNKK
jgi:hypothetical protein